MGRIGLHVVACLVGAVLALGLLWLGYWQGVWNTLAMIEPDPKLWPRETRPGLAVFLRDQGGFWGSLVGAIVAASAALVAARYAWHGIMRQIDKQNETIEEQRRAYWIDRSNRLHKELEGLKYASSAIVGPVHYFKMMTDTPL